MIDGVVVSSLGFVWCHWGLFLLLGFVVCWEFYVTSGVTGVFINQCGMLVVTGICVTEVCLGFVCHRNLCLVTGCASYHLDHFLFLLKFSCAARYASTFIAELGSPFIDL